MMTMDEIKRVLFSDVAAQATLLTAMGRKGHSFDEALDSLFFQADENTLQKTLAPFLRARAIKHLKESPEDKDVFFRNRYTPEQLQSYLEGQGKPGVFGADEEAIALADLFDVSLQVTIQNFDLSYRAKEADPERPIFHLYNQWQQHWYIYNGRPGKTLGDGNCLYNSFAQMLRNNILATKYPDLTPTDRMKLINGKNDTEREVIRTFLTHIKVYESQDALRVQFDKLPRLTHEELVEKIKTIPNKEKGDHEYALKLAEEDQKECSRSLSRAEKDRIAKINHQIDLAKAEERLVISIEKMYDYGTSLQSNGESTKCEALHRLARKLYEKALDFQFEDSDIGHNEAYFSSFKEDFSTLLRSEDATLGQYRPALNTIFANITLALTGIGLVLIAGKLIYSLATEGRPLFFFQKNKTTSEEKVRAVETALDAICPLSNG